MIWLSDKTATKLTPLKKSYTIWWKEFTFETGKIALLASWAVTISDNNDNILFVTAGYKEEGVNKDASFFPLVVDYQEKNYATWRIGWNRFIKREWRPSEIATLTARLIDRPIRPMFPKGIVNDTQIIATVLSSNSEIELWVRWITWASITLMMSWAPFEGPVSWVKVSLMKDNKYIYNPTTKQEKESKLNLIVAWTVDAISMVEADSKEISDEDMLKSLEYAHNIVKEFCNAQIDFIKDYKKNFWIPEVQITFNKPDESLYLEVKDFLTIDKLDCIYEKWKKEFQNELNKLDEKTRDYLDKKELLIKEDSTWVKNVCSLEEWKSCVEAKNVWALVYKRVKEVIRENILKKEKRLDGRGISEVREIIWDAWFLPRTHGSALFQRWMTQVLNVTTLWWPEDRQIINWMMPESEKRYMHYYNFPPYSVWEVRMMRWAWRREIWHGRLAEKAIEPVLPKEEDFPYTIRSISEVTTCNGSSSMWSVCASTMSLMNAWVPIKAPVSAVAMWMVYDENTWEYKILSDIQAQEDFLWDMDFKVARTKTWITAMQLDVKIKWLKMEVFSKAFQKWKEASDYILDWMLKIQWEVEKELSSYAPLIMSLQVPEDKIRVIIWKGWENIQRMEKEYEVNISIAEDWITTITAQNQEWWKKAVEDIKTILWEPNVLDKLEWKVVKIIDWVWAIVEFKWKSWMIHISKLSKERVNKVEDVVKAWDKVKIEVIQVDKVKWRIWLRKI